ncbi:hypothetical protein [Deinococcus sp.]|uniref:hypothetical protein n=1 Tax=Deinococcus sp. TaxID=47478 RepID=UPI0025E66C16|nr:hypothetical protein [Deinococcus sp.]
MKRRFIAAGGVLLGLLTLAGATYAPPLSLEQQAVKAEVIVRATVGTPATVQESAQSWTVYPLTVLETLAGDAAALPRYQDKPAVWVLGGLTDGPMLKSGEAMLLLYKARLDSPLVGFSQGQYSVDGPAERKLVSGLPDGTPGVTKAPPPVATPSAGASAGVSTPSTATPSAGATTPSAGTSTPSAGTTTPSAATITPSAASATPSAGTTITPSAGSPTTPSAATTTPSAGTTTTPSAGSTTTPSAATSTPSAATTPAPSNLGESATVTAPGSTPSAAASTTPSAAPAAATTLSSAAPGTTTPSAATTTPSSAATPPAPTPPAAPAALGPGQLTLDAFRQAVLAARAKAGK